MVQRFKNPNRNLPRQQSRYVPEYRRHGVNPVPIDERGRLDEEAMDLEPAPQRGGLPLNMGAHDHAAFQVDGLDAEEENTTMPNVPAPTRRRDQGAQIEPGEYIILVEGQIVASGDESHIKETITSLIYNQSLNPTDIVVLRRMEVGFGVTIG